MYSNELSNYLYLTNKNIYPVILRIVTKDSLDFTMS